MLHAYHAKTTPRDTEKHPKPHARALWRMHGGRPIANFSGKSSASGGHHGSIANTIAVANPCITLTGTVCPTAPHRCHQCAPAKNGPMPHVAVHATEKSPILYLSGEGEGGPPSPNATTLHTLANMHADGTKCASPGYQCAFPRTICASSDQKPTWVTPKSQPHVMPPLPGVSLRQPPSNRKSSK